MEKFTTPVFEYIESKTQLGIFVSEENKKKKKKSEPSGNGIDKNLLKSLAIYGFTALLIILALVLFLVCKLCPSKMLSLVRKIRDDFRKKLFFNGLIRFLIESNLELTYSSVFYLSMYGSFSSIDDVMSTVSQILTLVMLVFWIFASFYKLVYARERLEHPSFVAKYGSLVIGFKTDYIKQFVYISCFSLRRLCLVLCLIYYKDNKYRQILVFLLIYSFYFLWLSDA